MRVNNCSPVEAQRINHQLYTPAGLGAVRNKYRIPNVGSIFHDRSIVNPGLSCRDLAKVTGYINRRSLYKPSIPSGPP